MMMRRDTDRYQIKGVPACVFSSALLPVPRTFQIHPNFLLPSPVPSSSKELSPATSESSSSLNTSIHVKSRSGSDNFTSALRVSRYFLTFRLIRVSTLARSFWLFVFCFWPRENRSLDFHMCERRRRSPRSASRVV